MKHLHCKWRVFNHRFPPQRRRRARQLAHHSFFSLHVFRSLLRSRTFRSNLSPSCPLNSETSEQPPCTNGKRWHLKAQATLNRSIEGAKSSIIHSHVDGENTGPVMSSYATSGRLPVREMPNLSTFSPNPSHDNSKKPSFHLYSQFSLNT